MVSAEKQGLEATNNVVDTTGGVQDLGLTHISSAFSHELPAEATRVLSRHSKVALDEVDVYDKFSAKRKRSMLAILCLLSFLAPLSSTSVLAATPDVAASLSTTGTIINVSNAFYMLMCAFGPCMTAPLSELYGRRWIYIGLITLFTFCSLGTALSPDLAAFFVFRLTSGLLGSGFLILGAATIGDIYRPTERGTAMGWFMSGTLIGPGIGPFLGGLITNFTTWRVIFYMQTGLAAFGFVLVVLLLPETTHHKRIDDLAKSGQSQGVFVLRMMNPLRPVALFRYPNLIAVGMASSALVWNMYSLLTPIRYTLNPRFGLTSPLLGGLFFLAPGFGYFTGTFFGGRYADYVTKKWIKKRGGERKPQDRLRSCLFSLGVVLPACMLIYGWTVDKKVGGYPVPIIAMFVQGIAQLMCFPSLNTYCIDVMQHRSSEVIGGNYLIRYIFGAAGSAAALPAIQVIGVGGFSTISAGFLMVSAGMVYMTIIWGDKMKDWAEKPRSGQTDQEEEKAAESV